MRNNSIRILLASISAAFALCVAPAHATESGPVVQYVPVKSNPPIPDGLKVACMPGPDDLRSSETCPVVEYQGITTWAYSFMDNRLAFALVSYDDHNKVVRNVTQNGARYVWRITVDPMNSLVTVSGQGNHSVTVPLPSFGP